MAAKTHSCKIGTVPMLVIFQRNYKLAVGKVITVRPHDKAHQWFEVRITELGEHGYFLADRA